MKQKTILALLLIVGINQAVEASIMQSCKRAYNKVTLSDLLSYGLGGVFVVGGILVAVKLKQRDMNHFDGLDSRVQNDIPKPLTEFERALRDAKFTTELRTVDRSAGDGLHDNARYATSLGLIRQGADANMDFEGTTLLQLACRSGNFDVAHQLIVQHGAEVDQLCWQN